MKNAAKTEVDMTLVGPTLGVLILFGAFVGVQGFPNGTPLAQAKKELTAAQASAVPPAELARLGEERDALKRKAEEADSLLKSRRQEAERVIGTTTHPVWRLQTLNRVHAALQKAGVAVAWDVDAQEVDALLGRGAPTGAAGGPGVEGAPRGGGGGNLSFDDPQLLKSYRDALVGLARSIADSSRPAGAANAPAFDPTAFAEVPEGLPGALGGAVAQIQPPTPDIRVLRLEATYRQMLTALAYLQQNPGETMAVAAFLRRPTTGGAGDESLDWVLLLHVRQAPAGDASTPATPSAPALEKGPRGAPAPKRRQREPDPSVVSVPAPATAESDRTAPETRLVGARRGDRATIWTSPALLESSRPTQDGSWSGSVQIHD